MNRTLLAVCLLTGCATVQRPDELARDTIHERHNWCMHVADEYAHAHGVDAWRYLQCDREEQIACVAAGLERQCGEWQWGGT